jgi:hypothetical protein
VRIFLLTDVEHVRWLLARARSTDAIDLLGLTALVDLVERDVLDSWTSDESPGTAGLLQRLVFGASAQPAPRLGRRTGWMLPDALDRRTNAIEAFTKLVGTPSGVRFVDLVAGEKRLSALRRLAGRLVGRPRATVGELRTVILAAGRSAGSTRVPPRLYLTPGGTEIIDGRGIEPGRRGRGGSHGEP